MPIKKAAYKHLRRSKKQYLRNQSVKEGIRDVTKELRKLILEGKKEEATKLLPKAFKTFDKAAKRGVIHQNTASRKKARLTQAINKIK